MKKYPLNTTLAASRIEFQPGDGTRYAFIILPLDHGVYDVVSINMGQILTVESWQIAVLRRDFPDVLFNSTEDYQRSVLSYVGLLETCKNWAPKGVNPYTMLAACVVVAEQFS